MINLPGTYRLSSEDFRLQEALSRASEPLRYTTSFANAASSAASTRHNVFGARQQPMFDGAYFHGRAYPSAPYSRANIWPHRTTYARFDDFSAPRYGVTPSGAAANENVWSTVCALPFTIFKFVARLLYLPFELLGTAICAVANLFMPATPPQTAPMPRATQAHQRRSPAQSSQAHPDPFIAQHANTMRSAHASSTLRATSMPHAAGRRDAAENTDIEAINASMLRGALAASLQPEISRNTFDADFSASSRVAPTSGTHAKDASEVAHPARVVAYANPPICPISFLPLTQAVTTACEHAFDKDAMQMWLEQGHSDCPCCCAPVHKDTVHDDAAVRAYAQYWLQTRAPASSTACSTPRQTPHTCQKTALSTWAEQARRDIFPHPPECPISAEPFTDAVTTLCGHSFQYHSILQWVTSSSATCPCCRAPVYAHQLRPNRKLNQFSALWVKAKSPQTIPEPAEAALHPRRYLSPQALGMPDALTCAFSHLPLHDPVKAPCGHTFERSSIIDVLQAEERCPLDDQAAAPSDLVSDGAATRAVVAWQLKTIRGMSAENWDAIYFAQDFAYA